MLCTTEKVSESGNESSWKASWYSCGSHLADGSLLSVRRWKFRVYHLLLVLRGCWENKAFPSFGVHAGLGLLAAHARILPRDAAGVPGPASWLMFYKFFRGYSKPSPNLSHAMSVLRSQSWTVLEFGFTWANSGPRLFKPTPSALNKTQMISHQYRTK